MQHALEVWLFSDHVGTLTWVEGRLSFSYLPEWLTRSDSIALSCSLPLQLESFDDYASKPFFAGLLPEGDVRRLIAQQFQVSRQNDFALLDRMGGDCAGAVTFLNSGQVPPKSETISNIEWLTDEDMRALLDELPYHPMLIGKEGVRLSLAGAQSKLPVFVEKNRIGLPLYGTPSSHILKPSIRVIEDSVMNEGFCLTLAAAMKLKPARSRIRSIQNHTFLLVERYDRIVDEKGCLQRLHQEDFCQALSIAPELKYQNEGGPDLKQCFDLVRRVTQSSTQQVLRLFDYVLFNAMIGNHDAHAKNFSLLYRANETTLAPLYDVLSTAVYPNLTQKMAMKIGSKYKFSEVQARHWDQFSQAAGLSITQTRKRILKFAKQLPMIARKLYSESARAWFLNPQIGKIVNLIEQRAALTIRRLT